MIALLTGQPAFTQSSDSAVVNLAADSPNVCLIRAEPVASAGTNATLASASDSASVVSITQLADPVDASLLDAALTLTFAAMCNGAHTVTLTSQNGGLLNASRAANAPVETSSAFIRKVGYEARYTWAGDSSTPAEGLQFDNDVGAGAAGAGATSAASDPNPVAGSNEGDLVLTLLIVASETPVVEGAYADVLTFVLASVL